MFDNTKTIKHMNIITSSKFKLITFLIIMGLLVIQTSCQEEGEKILDTSDEDTINGNTMKLTPTMTAILNNGVLTFTTSKSLEAMPDYDTKYPPWDAVNKSIISVVIENSVSSIGKYAFYDCINLTSVTIPNSVTSIEELAFASCKNLISITLPNSVKSIGSSALSGCAKLSSITIPNAVSYIGENAFSNCTRLSAINVNADNPTYSSDAGVFYNKNKTTIILYPQMKNNNTYSISGTVTTIEKNAFFGCKKLTSITIPNSVKTIGEYAFGDCGNLSSLAIPASVNKIETNAFYNCLSLQNVSVSWTTPLSVPANIFPYVNTSAVKLYVPTGTKTLYQAANVWKNFGTIVEK